MKDDLSVKNDLTGRSKGGVTSTQRSVKYDDLSEVQSAIDC